MKKVSLGLVIFFMLLIQTAFAQEAFFAQEKSGISLTAQFASGEDYESKGFALMFLNKGKFFFGYEHDIITSWLKENNTYYDQIKQVADAIYIGYRNLEKPKKRQFFSFTIQTGFAYSTPDDGSTIRIIPVTATIFKQFAGSWVKIIPLIYGTYAYTFTDYNSAIMSNRVSTETSYGIQLNAVFRPIKKFNHGLAIGLDLNLKDKNAPLSLQISLAFNAFKTLKE